ncbi:hypothetical protein ACFQ0M_16970 [Kitasatospora aburaviensis]
MLDSRKPEARAFRRWITAEVIPSIRRTGSYSVAPAALRCRTSRHRRSAGAGPAVRPNGRAVGRGGRPAA